MKRFAFTLLIYSVYSLHDNVRGTYLSHELESLTDNLHLSANKSNMMEYKSAASLALSLRNSLTLKLNSHYRGQNRIPTDAPPNNSDDVGPSTHTPIIVTNTTVTTVTSNHAAATTTNDKPIIITNCPTFITNCPTDTTTTINTSSSSSSSSSSGGSTNTVNSHNTVTVHDLSIDAVIQLFMNGTKLAGLGLEEKMCVVTKLASYYAASPQQQQPPPPPPHAMVIANLVRMFAYTRDLFAAVSGQVLNDVLAIVTVEPCDGLSGMPRDVREPFAEGVLSLSAGVLYRAPPSAFATVLRAAASSRPSAPRPSAENLVTALSLSTPLFYGLPPAALEWTLRAVAAHPGLMARLPPSTVAAFLDRLLRAAADGYARPPLLAAVLGQAMTVRTLGVLPAGHLDRLLSAVGRDPELRAALPAAAVASLFDALAAAPVALNAATPDRLALALLAVTSGPPGCAPPHAVVVRLLRSMRVYSPRGVDCLPDDWLQAYWPDRDDQRP